MERQLYVYVYDYVDVPYGEVIDLLTSMPSEILQQATERAAARGGEIVTNLRMQLGRFEIGRDIRLEIGDPKPRGRGAAVFPLRWTAAESPALFPAMDARLEVAGLSLHPPISQVSLIADYEPPFGAVGAAGDVLAGHRVAESTVHRFVEDLVGRIERTHAERTATRQPAIAR